MASPVTRLRDGTYVGDPWRTRDLQILQPRALPIIHAFGAQVYLEWYWDRMIAMLYCQRCHRKLGGTGKRLDGKLLCPECWKEA